MKNHKDISKRPRVKVKIRKEDQVIIISGKEKGKSGKVLEVDNTGGVIVEGCNVQKKTLKKSKENPSGGIIEKESPIHVSNVMYMDDNIPTRLGYKVENGKKIRIAKKSGKEL